MSLEQRVTTLENQNRETNERLDNIEISVKNTQKDIQKLFLHSAKHELAIESFRQETRQRFEKIDERFEKIDERFDKIDERFDKIEDTLAIIVNHLQN